jgi:hypothetical protein
MPRASKLLLITAAALSLGGCIYPNSGSQPRALLWGAGQPACVVWCTIQIEVQNAEGDIAQTAGAVAQSRAQTGGTLTNKQSPGGGAKQ